MFQVKCRLCFCDILKKGKAEKNGQNKQTLSTLSLMVNNFFFPDLWEVFEMEAGNPVYQPHLPWERNEKSLSKKVTHVSDTKPTVPVSNNSLCIVKSYITHNAITPLIHFVIVMSIIVVTLFLISDYL